MTDLYSSRSAAEDSQLEASVLIHWDLPARSLKCFSQRCAALRSTVPNLFEKNMGGSPEGHCYFFVDKTNGATLK
jgi:hypothetical protein